MALSHILPECYGCSVMLLQVTKEEYTSTGSEALSQQLLQQLQAEGRRPYLIPVGGSNSLGTWGYLNATEELLDQSEQLGCKFTDIVMVCLCCLSVGSL